MVRSVAAFNHARVPPCRRAGRGIELRSSPQPADRPDASGRLETTERVRWPEPGERYRIDFFLTSYSGLERKL